MNQSPQTYTLFSDYDGDTADFTAAVTDVITDAAHGLSDGDAITVTSTTTLPAGLSLLTVYYVRDATTNTFKVATSNGGAVVDITGTGTGTHTWQELQRSSIIHVAGRKSATVTLTTSDTVDMTIKAYTSDSASPDFLAAQSATNAYDTVKLVDLEDGASIAGDTGLVTTTAETRRFNLETNGCTWFALVVTHSDGTLDSQITIFDN